MLFTARTRNVRKPVSGSLAVQRLTRPLAAAMISAARGAGGLKPLAALCLLGALVGSLLVPAIASAQTAPPPMSSLIVKLIPGLTPIQQADVIARNSGIEVSTIPALRLHVIAIPSANLAATLASYQADPQVVSAEENKTRQSETVPNDPLYADQWSLPRISWDLAFGTVTPTGSATVAVLDTGIDATHSDLGGKVIAGTSILDGSNGMTDPSGHGTWVAGIIAARTDTIQPEGIAGVAYAGVRLMPVTVLDQNGLGQDSDVIAGVIWAADNGADVIVMAFSNPGFSPNLQDAIDYAWSKGVTLVAAIGNGSSSDPTFPAGDRGVMGVSATDAGDSLAAFSNSGQAVFIAAPGTNIQTTDLLDSYTVISGSSASAAIVAGTAALLKAVDPTLTNGVIVGRLARTADPAGTQVETGNGRVNLARALADTGTDSIEPAGADPVGAGGPFVGPYVAAAGTRTTSTTVSCPSPVAIGQASSCTTTVTDTNNGNKSAPTGTFNVTASGASVSPTSASCVLAAVNGSSSSCTVSFTGSATGAISVTANYAGDGSSSTGHAASAGTASITVVRPTTTTVSCTSPVAIGEASSCMVTVADNGTGAGRSTITGTVNLTASGAGASPASTSCTLSGNQNSATCSASITGGSTGTISVSAAYVGDSNHIVSSGSNPISVNTRATSISVSCSTPVVVGQATSCTATVNDTSPGTASAPTGSVSLTASGAGVSPTSASCTLSGSAGSASCSASFTGSTTGTVTVSASYGGDISHASNGPASGSATVNKRSTTTAASCADPVVVGQASSCTITVSDTSPATAGTPTGTVSLTASDAGVSPASTSCTLGGSGSSATCLATFTGSGTGNISVSASYGGDGLHLTSSGSASITVNKRATSTSVSCASPVVVGDASSCTVTVSDTSPGTAGTSGAVNLSASGAGVSPASTSCTLSGSGSSATCSASFTGSSTGTVSVSASYVADTTHNGSGPASASITVNKRATSTAVSCAGPAAVGAGASCAVTVSDTSVGTSSTPTGIVNLTASGAGVAPASTSCTLGGSGSSATCSVTFTGSSPGTISVSATYAGDTTRATSSGSGSITVLRNSSTAVSCASPVVIGQASSCTVTVSDASTGPMSSPTGTVSVTASGAGVAPTSTSCTLVIGTGGNSSCSASLTGTSAGTISVSTSFAGDGSHSGSSGGSSITVNTRPTSTAVDLSPSTVVVGQASTVTVTVNDTAASPKQTPAGTVTVTSSVSGDTITGTCSLSQGANPVGTATCTATVTPASASNRTISVNFLATSVHSASSGSAILTATKGNTTTTITTDLSAATVVGQGYTMAVNVAASGAAAGTPTGSVSVTDGTDSCTIASLSSGAGSCPLTSTTTGGKTITATYAGDSNFNGSSGTKAHTVIKADQTITFNALASKTFGDLDFTVSATPSSGLAVNFSASGQCTVSGNLVHITAAGTCTITASQGGDATYNAAPDVPQSFSIAKAGTTLGLSGLSQPYDGSPKSVTVTTSPAGLGGVSVTYDGSTIAPTNAGSYAVVASLDNANYQASDATGTLMIAKASATLALTGLSQTYDGSPKSVTVATSPPGLSGVSVTYDGSGAAPINAGSYGVVASLDNANYQASAATGTLVIGKAAAIVTLGSLSQTYDGTPRSATATTDPGGLTVTFTYDGSPTAPTSAGSYTVVAAIDDINYQGSTTDTLAIAKAGTTTTLATSNATPAVGAPVTFTATVSPGAATGTVTFSDGSDPITCTGIGDGTVSGGIATCTASSLSAGTHNGITAAYGGDGNYSESSSAAITEVVDTPPVTAADAYSLRKGSTLAVNKPGVLVNDNDVDTGQVISAALVASPAGTVNLTGFGAFTYTPPTGFTGVDSFTYRATDGIVAGNTVTVTITVLEPDASLVARNDAYGTTKNVGLDTATVGLLGVLANDSGQNLTAGLVSGPANAADFALRADGSFGYTPAPDFVGVDSFLYKANDGTNDSNLAMVTIAVLPSGASLVAQNDAYLTTDGAVDTSAPGFSGVLVNDAAPGAKAMLVSGPVDGTVALQDDGSLVYTPGTSFTGVDSFIYRAATDSSSSNLAMVAVRRPVITIQADNVTYPANGIVNVTVTLEGLGPAPGSVTVTVDGSLPQTQALDSGQAQFTIPNPSAGDRALLAAFTSATYQGASTKDGALHVNKADQTITFGSLTDRTYLDSDFTVSATGGGSGNSLTFTASGQCSMFDLTTVHITGAGSCTITAHQAGNANYNAAPDVPRTFDIAKAAAAVSLGSLSHVYDGNPKSATATTTPAGLTVDLTYDGSSTAPTTAGSYTAVGTINDANYQGSATGTLVIAKADQTITFAPLADKTFGNPDFTVSATGGASGNPLTFAASDNCTVSGNILHLAGAGSCTITAGQAGTSNYNAAPDVSQTFAIAKATPIITWNNPADIVYGTALSATQLNAVVGSGRAGIFAYTPPPGTVLSAGDTQILSVTFTPADTANFNLATKTVLINVKKADQTITFAPLADKTYGDPDFAVGATASSGLLVSLGVSGTCTLPGSMVHITGAGSCTITAGQGGNTNYNSAPSVPRSFNIAKATASVILGNLNQTYDGTPKSATVSTSPNALIVNLTYNSSSVSPTNAGSYAVSGTVSNANYQGSAMGTLVISPATPVIGNVNTPTIILGTTSTTLTGTIETGSLVPAGCVAITLNGVTQCASIQGDGSFSSVFATSGLAVGIYPVAYNYAGSTDGNFANASKQTNSVTVTYQTGGACYGDAGHQILPPINPDGTSVFKQNSTVPAKFRVCDVTGNSIGTAGVVKSFVYYSVSGTVTSTVNETVDSTTPDITFRWDSTAQQWIFNISTKSLKANTTYVYSITLNDNTTIPFKYGLK